MVNIIIHGCGGHMGQVVASVIEKDPSCQIAAGIDPREIQAGFPTFKSLSECTVKADVIIDFSTASAISSLLAFAKEKQIPAVICTTGLSEEDTKKIQQTSQSVAILKSANMSVGVNLLINIVQKAAQTLSDAGFDIEIVEKHHNQKIDAPSGTALAIADAIKSSLAEEHHYVFDRSQKREKREKTEIGIHAIRGGTIVGEHDIIFAGRDEVIEFNHKAMSKDIFAVGAVKAAKFLAGQKAGFYTMKDVMD